MGRIKFGCEDIDVDGFSDSDSTIDINCIDVSQPDGAEKLYAYSGFLGTRLCELDVEGMTDYARVSIFPYSIQSTLDDADIDDQFGRGNWTKHAVRVSCRLPIGFDWGQVDSGAARTTNVVVRGITVIGEVDRIRSAMNAIDNAAEIVLGGIVGGDSSCYTRFSNLWYEISAWNRVDTMGELELTDYVHMLNVVRAVKLAAPARKHDLAACFEESGESKRGRRDADDVAGHDVRIRVRIGERSNDSGACEFDDDGLIRFAVAVLPFVEAGVTFASIDWQPDESSIGTIESRFDAYRLARFASIPECDGGYGLSEFIARSVVASPWGDEVLANDEMFDRCVAARLGVDGLRAVRSAIGSYRFDKLAGDLIRYNLGVDGSGIYDDWDGLALADADYDPNPRHNDSDDTDDDAADADDVVDDDFYAQYGADDFDDYDCYDYQVNEQFEEYMTAFLSVLPLLSDRARSALFEKLPGLCQYADEKTGKTTLEFRD